MVQENLPPKGEHTSGDLQETRRFFELTRKSISGEVPAKLIAQENHVLMGLTHEDSPPRRALLRELQVGTDLIDLFRYSCIS